MSGLNSTTSAARNIQHGLRAMAAKHYDAGLALWGQSDHD
jgi:hypothetical protein